VYNLFSLLLDYTNLNLKKSGQNYQFSDSGPINTLFTELPGTYLTYTDIKKHRVTENPSEFSPENHLCKVKKRVGCLPPNGTLHHETCVGLD